MKFKVDVYPDDVEYIDNVIIDGVEMSKIFMSIQKPLKIKNSMGYSASRHFVMHDVHANLASEMTKEIIGEIAADLMGFIYDKMAEGGHDHMSFLRIELSTNTKKSRNAK